MTKQMIDFQASSVDVGITKEGVAVLTCLVSGAANVGIFLSRNELVRLQYRIEQELARVPKPPRKP